MGKKKFEVQSGSNVDQNVQDFELLDEEEKSRILSFIWLILHGPNIDISHPNPESERTKFPYVDEDI